MSDTRKLAIPPVVLISFTRAVMLWQPAVRVGDADPTVAEAAHWAVARLTPGAGDHLGGARCRS